MGALRNFCSFEGFFSTFVTQTPGLPRCKNPPKGAGSREGGRALALNDLMICILLLLF